MVGIGKYTSIQSTNIQQKESQSSASQPQAAEPKNTQSNVANSAHTWQRASLMQDGAIQQSILNHQLSVQQTYEKFKQESEKAKEASDASGSLFGAIFGGPIIGSFIGNSIETNVSETEAANKSPLRDLLGTTEEEMKKMHEQLKEVQDNSFIETATGKDLPLEAYTKVQYDPEDDWVLAFLPNH